MCAGAVVNGRVGRLVYGATDPKAGAVGSLYDVPRRRPAEPPPAGHRRACWPTECGDLLRSFFAARRR